MKAERSLPLHLGENKQSKSFVFRHSKYQGGRSVVFSYAKGKNRDLVLKQAVKFTRRKNKTLPRVTPYSTAGLLTARNTSSIVGVSPARTTLQKPSGKKYTYFSWRAAWAGCPHSGGVTWPCRTHGCKDAFVLAVLTRAVQSLNRHRILGLLEAIRGTGLYRAIVRRKVRHDGCSA